MQLASVFVKTTNNKLYCNKYSSSINCRQKYLEIACLQGVQYTSHCTLNIAPYELTKISWSETRLKYFFKKLDNKNISNNKM